MNLPRLILERDDYRTDCTFGKLFVENDYHSEMLELPWRGNAPNVSCIPCGEYRYCVTHSPRFKRPLIELSGVPNRFKIRLHAGNFPSNTQGCPLFGTRRAPGGAPAVEASRDKEDELMARLAPLLAQDADAEGIIEIRDAENAGRAV